MNPCAKKFLETLRKKEISVANVNDGIDGTTRIRVNMGLKNTNIKVNFIFEDEKVGIRCYSLLKVNEDQFASALICCNELNCKKRWVKFCIDEDFDVNIEDDAIVSLSTAGEEVFELLIRLCMIADEAYPVLNKAIWC